ncbi:hypothetical protein [Methylobacterium flocculans]|uniref:hypothetical protein n=1 Tax=Methylobacterium flocculans TaxID=2984843 RepID=UPI00384CAEC7
MQPNMSVSFVTRWAGIGASQLFAWTRRILEGNHQAVQADEDISAPAVSDFSRHGTVISSHYLLVMIT